MKCEIDRRAFIASLGGAAVVAGMTDESKADALEDYAIHKLDEDVAAAQGIENLFLHGKRAAGPG